MILKIDNLSSEEFASLGAFLSSEKNLIKEHRDEDGGYLIQVVNGVSVRVQEHFATLTSSRGLEDGTHNVVLKVEEVWTEFNPPSHPRTGIRVDERLVPLHIKYLLDLMKSVGRYKK
jgi:hypothetical protein